MVIGLYPCTCDYVAMDALVTISLYECFYYDFIQLWIIYKHLILKSTRKHMMFKHILKPLLLLFGINNGWFVVHY